MHLDASSLDSRDKDNERLTVASVNAALAKFPPAHDRHINVLQLSPAGAQWVAETMYSLSGEADKWKNGPQVKIDAYPLGAGDAESIAAKIWERYDTETLDS